MMNIRYGHYNWMEVDETNGEEYFGESDQMTDLQ